VSGTESACSKFCRRPRRPPLQCTLQHKAGSAMHHWCIYTHDERHTTSPSCATYDTCSDPSS